MASSSNNEHHGGQQRPGKLARHNSSFIGAIKSIVKAPLTWFANQDDADNSTPGKRRRQVDQEPTEEFVDHRKDFSMYGDDRALESDDETSRRTKRMRLHSPPIRTSQPYLDPPAAALRRAEPSRRSSIIPRASSAVLPSTRATLSPRRHLPVTRTMSIDPPQRPLVRRESSAFNFGPSPSSAEPADYEMAIDSYGDVSMPPSPRRSPRPSFRLRSSVTPQPQPPTRYISEPPPLNTLVSHPVFLRPPAQTTQPVQTTATPTLGALVESVRATKSPTRQHHSSLFLASSTIPTNNENNDAPAERALHLLDVYKTPLLPTRMRSANLPASVTATTTPDMFKSRRKSHLVLMQDDKDRLGRKGSGSGRSSVVNETKPYAGEGGMKKLLARRKQEAEEEGDGQKEKQIGDRGNEDTPRPRQPSPVAAVRVIPDPPIVTGADWFSTAASTTSTGSSLRVGRSTNRNHLARPAKSRFSAKYDEEADAEDTEAQRSERRREMAEEAVKLVPLFAEPPGFSFSLEAPPMEPSKDDDPSNFPISSLPFSIAKSSTPSSQATSPKPPTMTLATAGKEEAETPKPFSSALATPPAPARVPTPELKVPATAVVPSTTPAPPPPSNGGLPNFFASSKILKETKLPAPPPPMNFGIPASVPANPTVAPFSFNAVPSAPPSAATPAFSKPVHEPENPFWDSGVKKLSEESKSTPSLFPSFEQKENSVTSDSANSAPPASLFGGSSSAFAPIPKASTEVTSAPSTGAAAFSFGKPTETPSLFGAPPSSTAQPTASFSAPVEAKPETLAPKPLFGAFGDSAKPSSGGNLFGELTQTQPQPTPSPLPFTFGAPPAQSLALENPAPPSQPSFFGTAPSSTPAVETPKSLFGGTSSTAFSFAQPLAEKKEAEKVPFTFGANPGTSPAASAAASKPAPFTFGANPSTPPASSVVTPKPAPFSFGQSSTTPSAAPPISFGFSGGGSATADVSSKSLFSFGQPNVAPVDRPVTPPKQENEFRMEESPTRDLQQANQKPPDLRPTIGGGAFSFGSSSSSTTNSGSFFGAQQQTSPAPAPAPFSFNSSTSNPFAAKECNAEAPKPFGGFGQTAPPAAPAITTSFSFGQGKATEDAQRPLSGGGFAFGATPTPTSTTATTNAFSFGAPQAPNPFNQPATTGSAPSSPSTFSQPSPFSFGAPAPSSNGGFSFGSQPASPASGGNLTLPSSGFGSGGGFGQPQQPSSPFSGPIALAPSTSGGGGTSLFTIGSAPAPAPGGPRTIKKLPTRRGGAAKR